jgi:hypothetical protein
MNACRMIRVAVAHRHVRINMCNATAATVCTRSTRSHEAAPPAEQFVVTPIRGTEEKGCVNELFMY